MLQMAVLPLTRYWRLLLLLLTKTVQLWASFSFCNFLRRWLCLDAFTNSSNDSVCWLGCPCPRTTRDGGADVAPNDSVTADAATGAGVARCADAATGAGVARYADAATGAGAKAAAMSIGGAIADTDGATDADTDVATGTCGAKGAGAGGTRDAPADAAMLGTSPKYACVKAGLANKGAACDCQGWLVRQLAVDICGSIASG
ncbi:hypothetical protein BC831DRAFT_242344 [Entophlyctis helioformis]|nr:hypothetical protein BC831DRAFT_242344 [Entophlyctis helioformis]